MYETTITQVTDAAWTVFVVFLRIGPAVALSPGFSQRAVPARVKLLFGLLLSATLAPRVSASLPAADDMTFETAAALVLEVFIGIFIGLIARAFVSVLETAGEIISVQVSLAQMFGVTETPAPIVAHLLTVTGIAFVFSTPIIDQILHLFLASFVFRELTTSEVLALFAQKQAELVDHTFETGFALASGFIGYLLMFYLIIGFAGRIFPNLMVSYIGIPFVSLIALYFLTTEIEHIFTAWYTRTQQLFTLPFTDNE